MPRRLRIEFDRAIYHVTARGNARQDIVHDDDTRLTASPQLARDVKQITKRLLAETKNKG